MKNRETKKQMYTPVELDIFEMRMKNGYDITNAEITIDSLEKDSWY